MYSGIIEQKYTTNRIAYQIMHSKFKPPRKPTAVFKIRQVIYSSYALWRRIIAPLSEAIGSG